MPLTMQGHDGQEYEFDDHQALQVTFLNQRMRDLERMLAARKEVVIGVLLRTIENITTDSYAKDDRIAAHQEEIKTLRAAKNHEMNVVDTAIKYLEK